MVPKMLLSLFLLFPTRNNAADTENKWYTLYPNGYPEYCSTEQQMYHRDIPALDKTPYASSSFTTKLLHVTAVIRHGARTPFAEYKCWDGFDQQSWDCELNTLTAPPAQPSVDQLTLGGDDYEEQEGEGVMFLFEKRYDALQKPPQLRNSLNGTCQLGQLLLRGYVQELHNGRMLRRTYVREDSSNGAGSLGNNGISDDMVLFDLSDAWAIRPYEKPNLYYRADDDQRTIMSGQILLRGMFGDLLKKHSAEIGQSDPVIPLHTADRSRDILAPNSDVCPNLEKLWNQAVSSKEYIHRFIKSEEAKTMKRLMNELGGDFQDVAQDCLMTTICNDGELPDILNDFGQTGKNSQNFFQRLSEFSYLPFNYVMMYNDAAYSKLALGPLWVTILSNVLPYVYNSVWKSILPQLELNEPAPKLALYSAHDTTIMPLMATLGVWDEKEWAPYSSLMVIELHQVSQKDIFPSERAFRLLYNGNVITEKVEGCQKSIELCDITHLLQKVAPFATYNRDCGPADSQKEFSQIKDILLTKDGIISMAFLILFSFIFGSVVTFIILKKGYTCSMATRRMLYNRAPSVQYQDVVPSDKIDKSGSIQSDKYEEAEAIDQEKGIMT